MAAIYNILKTWLMHLIFNAMYTEVVHGTLHTKSTHTTNNPK